MKILFLENLGWIQVFLKNFSSHTHALKCSVFQKSAFSRFSIDQTCSSTDRKCDKKLGLNLPSSISSWLMLDRSSMIFNRSNMFFDRSKIGQWVFKKKFSLTCSYTFQKFFSCSMLTDPHQAFFCCFLPIFSQGFCLQVPVRPYYPFFFILFTIFHAF